MLCYPSQQLEHFFTSAISVAFVLGIVAVYLPALIRLLAGPLADYLSEKYQDRFIPKKFRLNKVETKISQERE